MTKVLTFEWPEELIPALESAGYTPECLPQEAMRELAAQLFHRKVLSLGQAAHLANMNLWDFIPFLGKHGIPVIDYTPEEFKQEMETVEWLMKKLDQQSQ